MIPLGPEAHLKQPAAVRDEVARHAAQRHLLLCALRETHEIGRHDVGMVGRYSGTALLLKVMATLDPGMSSPMSAAVMVSSLTCCSDY